MQCEDPDAFSKLDWEGILTFYSGWSNYVNGFALELHQRITSTIWVALYLKHKLIKCTFFLQHAYKGGRIILLNCKTEDKYDKGA